MLKIRKEGKRGRGERGERGLFLSLYQIFGKPAKSRLWRKEKRGEGKKGLIFFWCNV